MYSRCVIEDTPWKKPHRHYLVDIVILYEEKSACILPRLPVCDYRENGLAKVLSLLRGRKRYTLAMIVVMILNRYTCSKFQFCLTEVVVINMTRSSCDRYLSIITELFCADTIST